MAISVRDIKHGPSFGDVGSTHKTRPLIGDRRFRVNIYLKRGPSFGDFGSTYILNLPLIWRFRFHIYLKHGPSFGRTGSSYILNTTPHSATSAQLINTAPIFDSMATGGSGSTYLLNTHPHLATSDSVSSYILNKTPHLAISLQHIKHALKLATFGSG